MRNSLAKLVIPAFILAGSNSAAYAQPGNGYCQPGQSSGKAATLTAFAERAMEAALLAGLLTWNGPGSFKLPPSPTPDTGLVANAKALVSTGTTQSWAVGSEVQQLISMKPIAPIAAKAPVREPLPYRAPARALEL